MNSNQIQSEIKKLQNQLKEQRAKERVFYTIEGKGVVVMKRAESLPKSCAYWEGEKGAKTLKLEGDFKSRILSHSTVQGKGCIRITPLLKELGYKFNGKDKTWNIEVQVEEAPAEVPAKEGNPLV